MREVVAVAVVGLALAPGCALVFQSKLGPEYDPKGDAPPQCGTSPAPMLLDALLAVSLGAGSIGALQQLDTNDGATLGASLGLIAVAFGVSAIYGLHSTGECRRAEDAFEARTGGATPGPVLAAPMAAPPPGSQCLTFDLLADGSRRRLCMPTAAACEARRAALASRPDLAATVSGCFAP